MKKEIYESPNLLILQFETDDVIRTSNGGNGGDVWGDDIFNANW